MLTRFSMGAGLLTIACSSFACTSVDSDNVFTSGLYARVSATSDGTGETAVRTTLFLENPSSLNYIELEGDDLLTAYGPTGSMKVMRESQFLGMTSYWASFEIEDANSEFIIGFSRTIDTSAPDTRVTLPDPFDIVTAEGSSYSRAADDVVIDWDASVIGDDMDYSLSGTCIETVRGTIESDPGTLTILASEVLQADGTNVADSCTATVTITRTRAGVVDANYGYGGDAYAYQVRTFDFTSDL
jgi:hypothetical protein